MSRLLGSRGLSTPRGVDPYLLVPGAKPPGSPHADDDEFLGANGTALDGSWVRTNASDGRSFEHRHGKTRCYWTTIPSTYSGGIVKPSAGSGDFTITTRVHQGLRENYGGGGLLIGFGSTSPGSITGGHHLCMTWDGGENLRMQTLGSTWGYAGQIISQGQDFRPTFLQMRWATSTRDLSAWVSYDGVVWQRRGGAAVPDSGSTAGEPLLYGLAFSAQNSANADASLFADFFRVNWTADYDPTESS